MPNASIFYYEICDNVNRITNHHNILILKENDTGYYILMNKYIKLDPYDEPNIFYFFRKDGFVELINFGSRDEYKDFVSRYSPLHELYLKSFKKKTLFFPYWDPDSILEENVIDAKKVIDIEATSDIYIEI